MPDCKGLRLVGHVDCPGGDQLAIDGTTVYIGHIDQAGGGPAVSIVDASDPAHPRVMCTLNAVRPLSGPAIVRARDGLIVTNFEVSGCPGASNDNAPGGISVLDATDPADPQPMTFWPTGGQSVGRFAFDGRLVFLTPEAEGYRGNICAIVDLDMPDSPVELSRWHIPGQWEAGGEVPPEGSGTVRCHNPVQFRNHLYIGCWHAGWAILEISDPRSPRLVSAMDWSPPFPFPTHTAVPYPSSINGRDVMLVADADEDKLADAGPSFLWLVDITDGTRPMPFASYQIPGLAEGATEPMTGCRKPAERLNGTEVPVAWTARGVRVIDIANPHTPCEVAHFVPDAPAGAASAQTRDVALDSRNLIYTIDAGGGLHILERG